MAKYSGKKVEFRPEFVPGVLTEDVIIPFNGKIYQCPRGRVSMVPDYVKGEYERSQRAQEKVFETQQARKYTDPLEEKNKGSIKVGE